jgi:hypothetical protein
MILRGHGCYLIDLNYHDPTEDIIMVEEHCLLGGSHDGVILGTFCDIVQYSVCSSRRFGKYIPSSTIISIPLWRV